MSGIGGVRVFRGGTVIEDDLHRIAASLRHRGPSATSAWTGPDIGLAHTRMEPIGPGAITQPLHSADGRWVVVVDGVVHNGAGLRMHLDYPFRSDDDVEVVVAGLSLDGISFVERLRGHFALVAHDLHTDTTHLVRDRYGVVPLHYRHLPGGIAFGSEAKTVLAVGPAPEVDLRSLHDYLTDRVVPAPDTLFEGVKKVRPAHRVAIMPGGHLEDVHYWDPPECDPSDAWSAADAVEAVTDGVREAVRLSLVDGPLGVQLTDDLASHLVAAHVQQLRSGPPAHTFAVLAAGAGSDGGDRARRLAALIGTRHHEVTLTPADFADHWGRLTWHLDSPLQHPADVAAFHLGRAARPHVTALLTHAGGDELFGGRAEHRRARWRTRLPGSSERVGSSFSVTERERLLGASAPAARRSSPALGVDATDRALREELRHRLSDHVLEGADRWATAAMIRQRPALLDHRLVELALRLPAAVKSRGGTGQWVLREAARPLVPEELLGPVGPSAPVALDHWFGGHLRDVARDRLLGEGSWVPQVLDRTAVRELVTRHEHGARLDGRLWTLLALETWHRSFFSATPTVPGQRRAADETALPAPHA